MNVAKVDILFLSQRQIDASEVLPRVEGLVVLKDGVAATSRIGKGGRFLFHRPIELANGCAVGGDALRAQHIIRNRAARRGVGGQLKA